MPAVKALADAVLAAAVASLAEEGRPAFSRSFVSDGAVAYDCEQLAVEVETIGQGLPGGFATGPLDNATGFVASLAVHAVRCAPPMGANGSAPTPAQIDASATSVMGDASALLDALRDLAVSCRSVLVTGLTFPGPQGGFAVAVARAQIGL